MADEKPQDRLPEFHLELAKAAVRVALAEAAQGVFETNNDNRGPRVDEYQMVGGKVGQAWCAKFAYWCFQQAAFKLGVANPFPRIFGASEMEKWGTKENRVVTEPQSGDILVKEHRHVGVVTGPALANGTFPSVEGNTWSKTDFAHRKEGVYVLNNEKVSRCTFIRL
jgi:hypothetical protein